MKTVIIILILILINVPIAKGEDLFPDSLINEINYDYEITSGYNDGKYWTMCLGTLSLAIVVPDSTESILFCRANGPTVKHRYPPFYNVIKPLDITGKSNIDIKVEDIGADSYFRFVFKIGGTTYYSSHFAVNDLISAEDLERLKDTNSCDEAQEEGISLQIIGHTVCVECNSSCHIEIISTDGRSQCFTTVSQGSEIPLQPGVFIIMARHNNNITTKKIIVR